MRALTAAGSRQAPRLKQSIDRLRGAMLWLTGFSGAFVFMEPSPYEVASLLTILLFCLTGLALRAALMPLVLLLTLYIVGFSIAVIPVLGATKSVIWVLVSWYLAATAIFFAAMLGPDPQQRLNLLLRGYMAAAIIASLAAIVGYFQLVPKLTELFVLYGRARGTFNDPNVLGAFLVLPGLIALQRMLVSHGRDMLRGAIVLALVTTALLLSFSRGAWGQFAFSAVVLAVLSFLTSRSGNERLRIVLLAALGSAALAAFIAALLSIDQVAALFSQRASLDQSYDTGHLGRFGRHALGFLLALDHPMGIGALQFRNFFPEDPHNAYLNAFMSGGWLGGVSYATLTLVTLAMGLRFCFVATPWRKTYLVIYAAFVGVAAESAIIDSDHWRHYFLLLGLTWGLMAAARPYRVRRRGYSPAPAPALAQAGRAA